MRWALQIILMILPSLALAFDGQILSQTTYDFPPFANSGFTQTPEIEKYYETTIHDNFVHAQSLADIQRLDYSSDGLRVKGFVLTPKINQVRFPILVFNRGGNRDYGMLSVNDMVWLARFAAKGFVIVASQYRGNDGGEGHDEFGGADVHDVLNLIVAAKTLPKVDANRIYMMGHSRGGMQTYLTLKADHEIKAAAVLSGECDLKRGLEAWPDFEKNVYAEIIPNYYQNKEQALSDRSACNWADQIMTPVFILQGTADQNVQPDQATEMASKLAAAGKIYQIEMFPDQSHNFYFTDDFADSIADKVTSWFLKF